MLNGTLVELLWNIFIMIINNLKELMEHSWNFGGTFKSIYDLTLQQTYSIMEKSILLHCITPEELRQIIKEVIREELLEVRKQLEEKDSEVLMSRQETIDFLKIDSSTLWSWTKKGLINCYGIQARRYYKKEDVLNSLVLLKVKRA